MKSRCEGQSMIEYILVMAAIAIAAVPLLSRLETQLSDSTLEIAGELSATGVSYAEEIPASNNPPPASPQTHAEGSNQLDHYANAMMLEAVDRVATMIAQGSKIPPELKDFITSNQELVQKVSTGFNAVLAGDGFLQADRRVRAQVLAQDYQGAFTTIWEQSVTAVLNTALETGPIRAAIDLLPPPMDSAIKVELPQIARRAAIAAAESTWQPIGRRLNRMAWAAYNNGYAPRPNIPENYFE